MSTAAATRMSPPPAKGAKGMLPYGVNTTGDRQSEGRANDRIVWSAAVQAEHQLNLARSGETDRENGYKNRSPVFSYKLW